MKTASVLAHLSNTDLLAEVKRLAQCERQATAALIASLAELDARRLYLGEGCSSLFTYCTQVLHLSEHAAYGRIEAARAVRRFPVILEMLTDGSVNVTAVGLLAPHLTAENHREVLEGARHRTKREVEQLVAHLRPQPAVSCYIRKLPVPKPTDVSRQELRDGSQEESLSSPAPPARPPRPPAVVSPLAPERYKVQLTISHETYEKLRQAQDLLRHAIPNGDPAAIFDRALTVLLADLARTKLAGVARPRTAHPAAPRSRHIPAAIKRAVWARDGGRCAYVGTNCRCTETGWLEFHHVVPYAEGGKSVVENIELRCRVHNAYEAEQHFGPLLARESPSPGILEDFTELGPDRVLRCNARLLRVFRSC